MDLGRTRVVFSAAAAGVLLALPIGTAMAHPAQAATELSASCQTPVDLTASGGGNARIDRLDVGNHESGETIQYDRVVIGLTAPASTYQARYVPQIVQDGSGLPVTLRGDADLEVRIDGAATHDRGGLSTMSFRTDGRYWSGMRRASVVGDLADLVRTHSRDWSSLREATLVSDFEGVVVVGIGVSQRVDFKVFTLTSPDRLVIDLAMPGASPWNCASGTVEVYFFNQPGFVNNVDPFFVPVVRRVAAPAVAGGALHSLFHGPLAAEYATGLRLLASQATGFTDLRIVDGVAHVRLTGGCNSGGSTVSVGNSIFGTLKQFPTVRYVKIYDPAGQTGDPTGLTDSIPDCLNP